MNSSNAKIDIQDIPSHNLIFECASMLLCAISSTSYKIDNSIKQKHGKTICDWDTASLTLLPDFKTPFLLMTCFVHPEYKERCLVLLQFDMLFLVAIPGWPDLFWRERRRSGRGERDGRREGKLPSICNIWEKNA